MYSRGAISIILLARIEFTVSFDKYAFISSSRGTTQGCIFSFREPGRNPKPLVPTSTTGRVIIIFSTLLLSMYSEASPTATAVFPVPAGPVQIVTSDSLISNI